MKFWAYWTNSKFAWIAVILPGTVHKRELARVLETLSIMHSNGFVYQEFILSSIEMEAASSGSWWII